MIIMEKFIEELKKKKKKKKHIYLKENSKIHWGINRHAFESGNPSIIH